MVDLIGLLVGRRLAGTDRPHRLICNDNMPQLLGGHTGQRLLHLNGNGLPGDIRFPLLQRLAYAQNNLQAAFQRRAHPLGHRLIGLAKVLPALAMPDNDILHPQLLQHRR